MFVIGTAGHVDHGKSTLIECLTGIDPDRLREEKTRGMTIELGFAWLELEDGGEVSIVDVPGHERFVRTMLMGAGGFDLALLVVAADEGPMPQTLEHLAILDILDVQEGIVVITKSDLADPELIELVEMEVAELLEGTSLSGSPSVAVAAQDGIGLVKLRRMITEFAARYAPRADNGRPRLFVDRAFSVAGFGAVVTGTLDGGALNVGDNVEILPSRTHARVRGLQSRRSEIEVAVPGTRVAVSLSGVSHRDIERGDALVKRNQFATTNVFDASIRSIVDAARPLKHNHQVTVYGGAWEEPATVRLLDRNQLNGAEHGWAQIKIANRRPIVPGDHYVIRDSNDTLGGGVALIVDAPRRRRRDAGVLEQLRLLAEGRPRDIVLNTLSRLRVADCQRLATSTHLSIGQVETEIADLHDEGEVVILRAGSPSFFSSRTAMDSIADDANAALTDFHRRFPLRRGMPREEFRNRLNLGAPEFDALMSQSAPLGGIEGDATTVRAPGHSVALTDDQKADIDRFLSVLREHRYSPPAWNKIDPELLGFLVDRRDIVTAGAEVAFASEVFDEMRDQIIAFCEQNQEIAINDVREMLGTSRKYSLALLEQLDRDNITMRIGDMRRLR